jgi:hypothetical protein
MVMVSESGLTSIRGRIGLIFHVEATEFVLLFFGPLHLAAGVFVLVFVAVLDHVGFAERFEEQEFGVDFWVVGGHFDEFADDEDGEAAEFFAVWGFGGVEHLLEDAEECGLRGEKEND